MRQILQASQWFPISEGRHTRVTLCLDTARDVETYHKFSTTLESRVRVRSVHIYTHTSEHKGMNMGDAFRDFLERVALADPEDAEPAYSPHDEELADQFENDDSEA